MSVMALNALDISLTDGSEISGEIEGSISIRASFGVVSIEGHTIKAIVCGDAPSIELVDGSIIVGSVVDAVISVKWKYGVVEIETSQLASMGPSGGAQESQARTIGTYEIGDRGPAGGIVFYDKGSFSDGWRYLEAAPSGWYNGGREDPTAVWANEAKEIGTAVGIGSGIENTAAIAERLRYAESGRAAQMCDDLEFGGYNDWFLPSKDELNQLYRTRGVVGGFAAAYYWSSSESSAYYAWVQLFSNGYQFNAYKNLESRVRSVRAF